MAMDLLEALRGAEKAQISTVQSFPCESAARLEEPAQYWQGSGRKRGKRRVCDWSGWMPIIIITKTDHKNKNKIDSCRLQGTSDPLLLSDSAFCSVFSLSLSHACIDRFFFFFYISLSTPASISTPSCVPESIYHCPPFILGS
jgi:hypothetical protein